MSLVSQFSMPHGAGGRLAGWIMGTRGSNVARNRWVVDLLELKPTDRVLEIGTGPGVAVEAAAAQAAHVVGIDPSDVMVSMARRRNREAVAAGTVDLRLGSSDDLPDGPFDAAFAVNTVIFWPDVPGALADLHDRMAPGGRVALVVQPRWKGATDADARTTAEENVDRLLAAGFVESRVEMLALRPVDAGCALAFRPPG